MSYDIPDEIKYREKIVFGLDLKQLCYVCIFGLLAFFSYELPLQGQVKLILPATFCTIGLGFILLNLEEKASDLWHFYTSVRQAGNFEPQAHKLLGIRSIEDSQITLRDGGLRAVIQVEPVNFSLLDEGQKKAFVSNYREFLNHFTTQVSILVKTESSDAEETFKRMQERIKGAEKEIAELFRDAFSFEREYFEKQVVRGRKYYLIVAQPSGSMIEKRGGDAESRAQLDQKTKIIQEKLSACGLRSGRLDTGALMHFFSAYSIYGYGEEIEKKPEKEVKPCCDTHGRKSGKNKRKKKPKKGRKTKKKARKRGRKAGKSSRYGRYRRISKSGKHTRK